MGSGDPSGLQNRRELASLALVSSTLTRFRQFRSVQQRYDLTYRVFVEEDGNYGQHLTELSGKRPVWVVNTPTNRARDSLVTYIPRDYHARR
jgi:hypothetical protein